MLRLLLLPLVLLSSPQPRRGDAQAVLRDPRRTRPAGAGWPAEVFQNNIEWLTRKRPPLLAASGQCAIVGSGAALAGRSLGHAIDSHDVVIRVNRLNNGMSAADLGARTDVWFSKMSRISKRARELYLDVIGLGGKTILRPPCRLAGPAPSATCPFKAFVFRGGSKTREGQQMMDRRRALLNGSSYRHNLGFPIGQESGAVFKAAERLVSLSARPASCTREAGPEATMGFHAILTFASHCRHISLFGFTGNSTFDGHAIVNHNLDREHDLLREWSLYDGGPPQHSVRLHIVA